MKCSMSLLRASRLIDKMADDNAAEQHAPMPNPTPYFTLPIHNPTTATSARTLTVNAISLILFPVNNIIK
jgi:hypothetical protein